MSERRRGGGQEGLKITQYERRFGDDRRSSRKRIFRPWVDYGWNLGCVCDVYRAEIKTNKERKYAMKLETLLQEILWEIESAGKDCPESLRQFEEKIRRAISA